MSRARFGLRFPSLLALLGCCLFAAGARAASEKATEKGVTQGALRIVQSDGGIVECPLKHTDVKAEVSGFIARVRVTQTFTNPTSEKIEAVYVFPLPHEAAVDDMTMVLGDRKIVGLIKRRQEARAIYEQALASGQTAALLEQERPNIFTQSVGNIAPGQDVRIEISYVDVLRYDVGTYEFHFPMVVGPRYIPGSPSGSSPEPRPAGQVGKVSPPVANTDRVPDAERISPPVLKPGYRTGHDISLSVSIDAGVPIQDLKVANHQAETNRDGESKAKITLAKGDSIPNKDFVVRYAVMGKKPEMAVLGHTGNYTDTKRLGTGYFMLMIQPAEDERLTKSPPREIVFLVDVSGSMSGEPTAKVIEAMQSMLRLCRPQDTVQVITFASNAQKLFEKPLPVEEPNITNALNFTAGLKGGGGTEMLKGVKMAIDEPIDKQRLRIVVMLTDGYIGNEAEIIEHVGKNCGDQVRFWCIGIGSSPNMFLVDGVAKQGGGMGKKLGLKDETQPLTQEIMTRIQRAQLAKIQIDWGELKVSETYPAKLPELWAGRPVIVYGRYSGGGRIAGNAWQANIKVSGRVEGESVEWPLTVQLPANEAKHDVLAKVWARQKIEDLMQQTYYSGSPAVEETVTAMALDYKLMSQYTSFVAVDAQDAKKQEEPARPPRRMMVPVPLPEGTRWEGFFGETSEGDVAMLMRVEEKLERKSVDRLYFKAPMQQAAKQIQDQALRRSRSLSSRGDVVRLGQLSTARGLHPASPMPISGRFGNNSAKDGRFATGRGFGSGGLGGGGGFGGGGFGGEGLYERSKNRSGLSKAAEGRDYTVQALADQPAKQTEALPEIKDRGPQDWPKVRETLLRAYFFDAAAANFGRSEGSVAAQALEQLEELHTKQIQHWAKELPQLDKRLDLVLRDKSITEALAEISKASGLKIALADGSLADVTSLLGEEPRVTYVDLRRATVSQAVDWVLQPARLSWWPEKGAIKAGADRRREGVTAWVYDVADIALPLAEDLQKLNDHQKAVAESKKAADQFIGFLRRVVKGTEESVTWYGPGQLLVIGDQETHAKADKFFSSLRSPGAKQADSLAEVAAKRLAARKEPMAKDAQAAKLSSVAMVHQAFAWKLLAAAAAGSLDDESLTELEIAWRDPATAELLKGESSVVALRSLWTIQEAAQTLSDDQRLSALAASALKQSAEARTRVAAKPTDEPARWGLLYAALATPEDAAYGAQARSQLEGADNGLPGVVARILLGEPAAADRKALLGMLDEKLAGPDRVALAAMAARRAGDDVWQAFRAASADILGGQELPGEVIVLVNELSQPALSVLAAR